MRALLQRVTHAECRVNEQLTGSCEKGLLVLLGVGPTDEEATAQLLWEKIRDLRIFEDSEAKTNLSLINIGGGVLIVSQFTLYADCRRGRRPSFNGAANPLRAKQLYDFFCAQATAELGADRVGQGIFGADMQLSLTNDGPFTIWLDTNELVKSHH